MVSILAHLARFMLVDLTDASRASDAVATIIPQTFVPVQPLIKSQPLMIDGKAAATHDTTYCAFITTSSPNCDSPLKNILTKLISQEGYIPS